MKKSIRNLILGAAMAIGVFAASLSAFAGQFVQNDMNFRSGASKTSASIGSVPVGAEVDVLGSVNDWDLVSYNGKTGYVMGFDISDGNCASKHVSLSSDGKRIENLPDGTAIVKFIKNSDGKYVTIVPPAGALVQELPDDYDTITLEGKEYYKVDDTVYKLTIIDGSPYFEVLGQMTGTLAQKYDMYNSL